MRRHVVRGFESCGCRRGWEGLFPHLGGGGAASRPLHFEVESVAAGLFRFSPAPLPLRGAACVAARRPSVVVWARPTCPPAAHGVRWSRSAAHGGCRRSNPALRARCIQRLAADGDIRTVPRSGAGRRLTTPHAGQPPAPFGFRGGRVRQVVRRGREARGAVHGTSHGHWGHHPRAPGVSVAAMARLAVNRTPRDCRLDRGAAWIRAGRRARCIRQVSCARPSLTPQPQNPAFAVSRVPPVELILPVFGGRAQLSPTFSTATAIMAGMEQAPFDAKNYDNKMSDLCVPRPLPCGAFHLTAAPASAHLCDRHA
jgi:hypothetical protein